MKVLKSCCVREWGHADAHDFRWFPDALRVGVGVVFVYFRNADEDVF